MQKSCDFEGGSMNDSLSAANHTNFFQRSCSWMIYDQIGGITMGFLGALFSPDAGSLILAHSFHVGPFAEKRPWEEKKKREGRFFLLLAPSIFS